MLDAIQAVKALQRKRLKTSEVTPEMRRQWAEAIRAPLRNHPKQWAFVSSPAKLKVTDKNRRAGGTEGIGRYDLADLIEQDGLLVWVFVETLGEYTRNWLQRRGGEDGGDSAIDLIEKAGVPHSCFRINAQGPEQIKSITFAWGSMLLVLPAADATKVSRTRGGRPHRVRIDECQNLKLITMIMKEIVAPASADFDTEVMLSGTPGKEVDTFFHKVATGGDRNFEVHHFYSWDNPFFGETWAERYHRGVWSRMYNFQDTFLVDGELLEALRDITEETALALAQTPVEEMSPEVKALFELMPDDVLRELFGRWVAESSEYVFAAIRETSEALLYWGEWDGPQAMAYGSGTLEQALSAPVDLWPARWAKLPRVSLLNGQSRPKPWIAGLGADFGFYPGYFALTAGLWSVEDEAFYEFDSCKLQRLTEPQQFDIMAAWCRALLSLGAELMVTVCDSGGAQGMPTITGWIDKLRPLLPHGQMAVEAAAKSGRFSQIYQLNAEMRGGRHKLLKGSPLDTEGRYLQWEQPEEGKPKKEINASRVIELPNGRRAALGNHCLDADRYLWYWATHLYHATPKAEKPMSQIEALALAARRAELG